MTDETAAEAPPPTRRSRRGCVVVGAVLVLACGGMCLLPLTIRVALAEAFEINGPSVEPTLLDGDRVIVSKSDFGFFRATERIGRRQWHTLRRDDGLRDDYPRTAVPDGHVFLLGDHRDRSNDSRNPRIGLVPVSRLKGRVLSIYWSMGPDGVRWERFPRDVQ